MFSTPCDLAKYLETLTSNVLDLERSSRIWKVRETSITDFIVASFMAQGQFPQVKVDGSNEATTNADFEVIFRYGNRDLTLLIQAKRSEISGSGSVRVPQLFHPNASGSQNLSLIRYAARMKMVPLYALYFSSRAKHIVNTIYSSPTISGVMLNSAIKIRDLGYRKSSGKRNILQVEKILPGLIPFHAIFCMTKSRSPLEDIAERLLGTQLSLSVAESSRPSGAVDLPEFTLDSVITESISLEERRIRDRDIREYRDDPYSGFQTFRVLIDLDESDIG